MSDRNRIYAVKRLIAKMPLVSSTDLEHIAIYSRINDNWT